MNVKDTVKTDINQVIIVKGLYVKAVIGYFEERNHITKTPTEKYKERSMRK